MNVDLLHEAFEDALRDADKWYELYLGQKLANQRLEDEINKLKAELLTVQHHYDIVSEMLIEKQNLRETAYG